MGRAHFGLYVKIVTLVALLTNIEIQLESLTVYIRALNTLEVAQGKIKAVIALLTCRSRQNCIAHDFAILCSLDT